MLWFAQVEARFPSDLRELVESPSNGVFVSEISVLEITIKHAKNPGAMPYSGDEFVRLCEDGRFTLRPITRETILTYGTLDFDRVGDLHRDAFDRLLIAQSKAESLLFATHDRLLALYGEPLVKVYV